MFFKNKFVIDFQLKSFLGVRKLKTTQKILN